MIHTGDITQNSKASEFDTAVQVIKSAKVGEVFYVPGEHDFSLDDGALYKQRFGKGTVGNGWYSYNHKGVHFVGLNNCVQVDAMGNLGADQLAWLKSDLAGLSASTPIVVFAHIPLWMVYEKWGWGTADGAAGTGASEALWFGHGVEWPHPSSGAESRGQCCLSHGDGYRVSSARTGSCAEPRTDGGAGGKLQSVLGITSVKVVRGHSHLAVVDHTLAEGA